VCLRYRKRLGPAGHRRILLSASSLGGHASSGVGKDKQKQIPCGDDNKKGKDNDKSDVPSPTLLAIERTFCFLIAYCDGCANSREVDVL
jgi:hypothetical protein